MASLEKQPLALVLMNTSRTTLLVALCAYAYTSYGATYYVKSGGSDAADGLSDANAWASLHAANTKTSNGDTILLNRGDTWFVTQGGRAPGASNPGAGCVVGMGLQFSEASSAGCSGLTPTQDITIGAYGTGAKPIIDSLANNEVGDMDKFVTNFAPIVIGGYNPSGGLPGGFTVQDLDLRGPRYGPAIQMHDGGNNNTIDNCDISGRGWAAESLVQTNGNSIVIENSYFDQITRAVEEYSKGVEFRGGRDQIVRDSIFNGYGSGGAVRFSNSGFGSPIVDRNFFYTPNDIDDWAWAMVVRDRDGGTVLIRNNVFSLVGSSAHTGSNLRAMAFWGDKSPSTRKIINNTIVSDGKGRGIDGTGGLSATSLAYNNIWISLQTVWADPTDGTTNLINNVMYDNAQKTDGVFDSEIGTVLTNPNIANISMSNDSADDAQLTVASTNAINQGYEGDVSTPAVDHGNNARSDVDIGAWEYGAAPPAPPSLGPVRGIYLSPIHRHVP